MGNMLYFVAVLLVIIWALGFFLYSLGSIIHLALALAVLAILVQIIRGNNSSIHK